MRSWSPRDSPFVYSGCRHMSAHTCPGTRTDVLTVSLAESSAPELFGERRFEHSGEVLQLSGSPALSESSLCHLLALWPWASRFEDDVKQ